jgi:hypothetical protein
MHRAQLILREFFVMMTFVGNRNAAVCGSDAQYPDELAHETPR